MFDLIIDNQKLKIHYRRKRKVWVLNLLVASERIYGLKKKLLNIKRVRNSNQNASFRNKIKITNQLVV